MKSSTKIQNRGFTLIEALLAATIFTVSAFFLIAAFNNGQMSLLNWEKNTEFEKIFDWAIENIDIKSLTRDEIEKGGDLTSVEGYRVDWKADLYPTQTLDLFVVEYQVTINGGSDVYQEFRETQLCYNSQWYEDDDREKLVEEKKELFEDMQKARDRR